MNNIYHLNLTYAKLKCKLYKQIKQLLQSKVKNLT